MCLRFTAIQRAPFNTWTHSHGHVHTNTHTTACLGQKENAKKKKWFFLINKWWKRSLQSDRLKIAINASIQRGIVSKNEYLPPDNSKYLAYTQSHIVPHTHTGSSARGVTSFSENVCIPVVSTKCAWIAILMIDSDWSNIFFWVVVYHPPLPCHRQPLRTKLAAILFVFASSIQKKAINIIVLERQWWFCRQNVERDSVPLQSVHATLPPLRPFLNSTHLLPDGEFHERNVDEQFSNVSSQRIHSFRSIFKTMTILVRDTSIGFIKKKRKKTKIGGKRGKISILSNVWYFSQPHPLLRPWFTSHVAPS